MKKPGLPIVILLLVLVSQVFPGIDLTHHLETSRVYHEMIAEGTIFLKNPYMLAGQQSTFTYGIPFYALAGMLWFLLGRFTIDVLMCVTTLLSFYIMRRVVKNTFYQTMSLFLLWGFVIPDSYIAYCANFFLWLTAYFYLKGKRYYQVPLAIACLTHPFAVVVGCYYAYKERRNAILIGIFLVYHCMSTFVFASQGNVVLPNIINTFIARVLIGIFPILLQEKIREKIIKITTVLLVGAVITANGVLFMLVEPMQIPGFYEGYHTLFKSFPRISGNMRVVDYDYFPSAYYFHEKGLTINIGSFFESWIPQTRRKWNDIQEYKDYLEEHHIDYVLICKECGDIFPGVHPTEKESLSQNYQSIWENQYYVLYSVD